MQTDRIAKRDVFDFKEQYCNENEIIIEIIKKHLDKYFKATILDVGSGIGDISFKALKGKKAILIDVNAISKHDYPCRPEHVRKQADFLDFHPKEQINTIFIAHTLQFIDTNIDELNNKIQQLGAEYVITVLNTNDDFIGELIEWTYDNYTQSNPELRIKGFPQGYHLIKSVPFKAKLKCNDFKALASQIAYLMLIDLKPKETELIEHLQRKLKAPWFDFSQSIDVYRKI